MFYTSFWEMLILKSLLLFGFRKKYRQRGPPFEWWCKEYLPLIRWEGVLSVEHVTLPIRLGTFYMTFDQDFGGCSFLKI
jgi:hypothetical protein